MKKCLFAVLALCLLLAVAGTAMADDVDAADVVAKLTGTKWKTTYYFIQEFTSDGWLVGEYSPTRAYTVSGNCVTVENDMIPEYPIKYYMKEESGFLFLTYKENGSLKDAALFPVDQFDDAIALINASLNPVQVKFGQQVKTNFLVFNLKDVRSVYNVDGYTLEDTPGQPFVFIGTVKNTSKQDLYLNSIKLSLMIGNKEFARDTFIRTKRNNEMEATLPAGKSGPLYIFCNLNAKQRAALNGATLTLSFKENLSTTPNLLGDGDYVYRWKLSAARAEAASKVEYFLTYFAEAPKLPRPTSYMNCYAFSGSPNKEFNLVTFVDYSFVGKKNETGKQLFSAYTKQLKAEGFTLEKDGKSYKVFLNGQLQGSISVSDGNLTVRVYRPDKKLKAAYFKESPALARPTSYFKCREGSATRDPKSGKLKSTTYAYTASGVDGSDLKDLCAKCMEYSGYTIKTSGKDYEVYYKNKKLALLTDDDGSKMLLQIFAGNEKIKTHP